MQSLTWPQVHAWRLARQFLRPRAEQAALLEVVSRLGGAQAQVMSAAEQSLGVRLNGLRPADVQAALWQDRTLAKTWVMRGTLHLVAAEDLPLMCAARSAQPINRPPSYYRYHGITPEDYDAIVEGVARALNDTPQTREQLALAVAEMSGRPGLQETLLSGWGALLKPSAFRGDLCFGPNQGQNVTFVKPQTWLGVWREVDPQAAVMEMARRYLSAYGPAQPADFARWWGLQGESQGKKVFRWLEDELVEVDVEGWKGRLLEADARALRDAGSLTDGKEPACVRLLPAFDAFTIGTPRDCAAVLPDEYKNRVYRAQGWISPVVLVDGRIAGTWEMDDRNTVQTTLFSLEAEAIRSEIEAETARLQEFLTK
jgi:hypothetical protein